MTPNPAPISAPLSQAAEGPVRCHSPDLPLPPCCCQHPRECPDPAGSLTALPWSLILTPNIADLSHPVRAEPHSPTLRGLSHAWEGSSGLQGLLHQLFPTKGVFPHQTRSPWMWQWRDLSRVPLPWPWAAPRAHPPALHLPSQPGPSGMPLPSGMEPPQWESRVPNGETMRL